MKYFAEISAFTSNPLLSFCKLLERIIFEFDSSRTLSYYIQYFNGFVGMKDNFPHLMIKKQLGNFYDASSTMSAKDRAEEFLKYYAM